MRNSHRVHLVLTTVHEIVKKMLNVDIDVLGTSG